MRYFISQRLDICDLRYIPGAQCTDSDLSHPRPAHVISTRSKLQISLESEKFSLPFLCNDKVSLGLNLRIFEKYEERNSSTTRVPVLLTSNRNGILNHLYCSHNPWSPFPHTRS